MLSLVRDIHNVLVDRGNFTSTELQMDSYTKNVANEMKGFHRHVL